ncbi:hypothetical protein CMO83_02275 [Candidatus Woesearchaeota archaeon]|nr:hypothetical protein [Candidatus Woesearchaeota archaeon]|tara:strand:+ start:11738 stop:12550 length:813 start_codon:yes stop_codon:yes gene_type:complete
MSAEKEIVNFWYNKKGLFTINNIKTSSNRDCGILALKFDKDKVNEVFHIEVSCSITNNISETTKLDKSISRIVDEKFENKNIKNTISSHIKQFSMQKQKIKKIMILGAVPKSRKNEIINKFDEKEVKVIEFENILYDVLDQLDTQYFKNDIIRTLQLTKFLLLSEPTKLAKLLVNDSFSSNSRKEFLSSILEKDEIMKDFKKTNTERLGAILKNSGLKPAELAEMIEHNILNKRTRRLFLDSLMEQQKTRKTTNKTKRVKKLNIPLEKFF